MLGTLLVKDPAKAPAHAAQKTREVQWDLTLTSDAP